MHPNGPGRSDGFKIQCHSARAKSEEWHLLTTQKYSEIFGFYCFFDIVNKPIKVSNPLMISISIPITYPPRKCGASVCKK